MLFSRAFLMRALMAIGLLSLGCVYAAQKPVPGSQIDKTITHKVCKNICLQ